MLQLANRVALITGVGSGIGRAAARRFAAEGARVIGMDVDGVAGPATLERLREAGGEGVFVRADVRRAGEVEAAVAEGVERYGRLDVLFNVVGASGRRHGDGPVADCTEEGWDWTLDVNLKSTFLCCKYGIRAMLQRTGAEAGGAVVNLSSVLGLVGGDADFATHAYATAKAGIIGLTRSIASYYAPQKIRANALCPGLIATDMSRRAQSSDAIRARLPTLQPLTGDFGAPEDVAEAALFLASDRASFITGAVLTVDGGWTVR